MSSSLWSNLCQCDLIDFLKLVESELGRSFLSLVTSASTRSPHTMPVTCLDASAFHHLLDAASWMSTLRLTLGRVRWIVGYRPPALPLPQTTQHPSQHLLFAIWQDQSCVQGREGRQGRNFAEGPPAASPGILQYHIHLIHTISCTYAIVYEIRYMIF